MKKILIVISAAAILAAVGFFICRNAESQSVGKERADYESATAAYSKAKPSPSEDPAPEQTPDLLAEARKVNPDTVAWLEIPDTEIDFPIVQCGDNDYYLSHDFEKNGSYMGVPFLDCRNTADFSDFNSVIYGHNISNKYMFYPLLNFKDKDFFDSHRSGYLTLSDRRCELDIIACCVIESDGFAYETVFLTKKEKKLFLKTAKEKAVQTSDIDEDGLSDERLITLSTCSYEFDGARTILVARICEQE